MLRFAMLVSLWAAGAAAGLVSVGEAAVGVPKPFRLQDQFNQWHKLAFPRARVVVLALADRKGSKQLDGWIVPLAERYKDTLDIHGIAQVAGVPAPLQPALRAAFRRKLKRPVMLDWTGGVSDDFDYQAKRANLVVLAPDGRVAFRFNGPATPEALVRCFEAIDRLLGASAPRGG